MPIQRRSEKKHTGGTSCLVVVKLPDIRFGENGSLSKRAGPAPWMGVCGAGTSGAGGTQGTADHREHEPGVGRQKKANRPGTGRVA
jgi:hypothetical protein